MNKGFPAQDLEYPKEFDANEGSGFCCDCPVWGWLKCKLAYATICIQLSSSMVDDLAQTREGTYGRRKLFQPRDCRVDNEIPMLDCDTSKVL